MNDVHEIMKYKRSCDSWLCPECDTENSVLLGKCIVCGSQRPLSATVLKQWTEEDDKPKETYRKAEVIEEYDNNEEETTGDKILWWIILGVLLVLILIGLSKRSAYATCMDTVHELSSDNCKNELLLYEGLLSECDCVSYMENANYTDGQL